MDPGTARGRWKASWSEGGWQCLPGSIPFTTDYAEQGHGGRWFWDRSMSKERQRSWERVWSRSFMMSNWGSWGYAAWRKRRFKGDLISLYNSLKGVCSKTGANLILSNRTRRDGLRLCQEKFRLDSMENFFTERGLSGTGTGCPGKCGVTIPECI